MWDMRRGLNVKLMPDRRCMIQFLYSELPPSQQSWWMVVDGGAVDLCNFDPGHELDLLVKSSLRSMTAIWMGLTTIKQESESGDLEIEGDPSLARSMQQWLGLSSFARSQGEFSSDSLRTGQCFGPSTALETPGGVRTLRARGRRAHRKFR